MLLAVNVVQRSVGFGRGVLFCRWLDPAELGVWEMAYGFLLLAAPLAVLGLPGSFGRYLTRYQDRGQLALFLRRTGVWTFGLASVVILFLVLGGDSVGRLVFGESASRQLVYLTAAALAAVIVHHFLEAVFAGLKLFRVVSAMHFCQSMVFAASALSLITYWRSDAASVVIGYAIGCVVSASGTLVWWLVRRPGSEGDESTFATPSHREFWPPLLQFALGLWVANLMANLFSIIDRYMILHAGGFTGDQALEQIGNYHTACLVPVLLVSVANLLVGAMTPHLSHDWEAGRRGRVSDRMNLALKAVAVGMLAAGAGVLLLCPPLFDLAFEAKYAAGLAVLPWTTAASVWFALLLVAQTYAWCAEKTRAASGPLAIGLVANVLLNLWWLPVWGLTGAVAATAVATLIALAAQLWLNQRLGMRTSPMTVLACLAPAVLAGGLGPGLIGTAAVLAVATVLWLSRGRFSRIVLMNPTQGTAT